MIVYNVTVCIEASITDEWLQWLQNEHAPEMMATGCFTRYTLLKLLQPDNAEGPTYAVQYYAEKIEDYEHYRNRFAAGLQKKSVAQWGEKLVSFSTLMEVVK